MVVLGQGRVEAGPGPRTPGWRLDVPNPRIGLRWAGHPFPTPYFSVLGASWYFRYHHSQGAGSGKGGMSRKVVTGEWVLSRHPFGLIWGANCTLERLLFSWLPRAEAVILSSHPPPLHTHWQPQPLFFGLRGPDGRTHIPSLYDSITHLPFRKLSYERPKEEKTHCVSTYMIREAKGRPPLPLVLRAVLRRTWDII